MITRDGDEVVPSPAGAAPLRIGVLGAARINGVGLFGPARRVPEVVVTAIAARDRRRAERVARSHGIAHVHDSYDGVVGDPNVDAVYVPLPNSLHARWTERALAAGKHVLCEKPFTSNAAEAERVASAAARAGRVVMEAFHWRHHPLAQRMVDVVARGELGPLRHVDVSFCVPLWKPGDIRYRLELAGGAMMDLGAYAVHILRHVSGEEPTVVSARALTSSPEVDRAMRVELALASGATARLHVSLFSSTVLKIAAHTVGERGAMFVRNPILPHLYHSFATTIDGRRRTERFPGDSTYTHQLRAFAAAVRAGRSTLCGVDDAQRNMRVIDAIYVAAGMRPRGV